MKIKRFEDLDAWKESKELTKIIYSFTKKPSFGRDYGLKDQIQRAAVSCMSNIAEGFDSETDQQFIQFLVYAKRSASEVQSILYVACEMSYINQGEFKLAYGLATSVRRLCSGFIRYLKKP